jgi:predicted PurR-regulated permease PerM
VSQVSPSSETLSKPPIRSQEPLTACVIASWILTGVALLAIVIFHLVSALLGALLVYELIGLIAPLIERHLINRWSRGFAAATLAFLIVAVITLATLGIVAFLKSDAGSPQIFADRLQHILTDARDKLPPAAQDYLPGTVHDLRSFVASWVDQHSREVQHIGRETLHLFVRGFIGMVIGALMALLQIAPAKLQRPLAAALIERATRFGAAFRHIVFAQVRISAVNTVLTAIFLLVLLPMLGIQLPLAKILVATTFIFGLLPIFGNIISNAFIVVAGLSISAFAAVLCSIFLVVIHKLEYFLNARIVGSEIKAFPWELMIALLVMESAFGLSGLVVAPIYYAYIKQELADRRLV